VAQVRRLPAVDCRLIEGAGGLAVPLDEAGHDWADFARAIRADATLLVVEDRLGAINQGRLLAAYAKSKRLPRPLFLLNRIRPLAPAIQSSNREGFRAAGAELLTAPQAIAALIASALGKPRATKTP
jgi:dethiobiotin synthetase